MIYTEISGEFAYDGGKAGGQTENPLKKRHKPDKSYRHKYNHWLQEHSAKQAGEAALWIAVITQAVMDAINMAANSEARNAKNEAIRWLTGGGKDFVDVCLLAGYEPDYIRRCAKRVIASPRRWRAEPGKGKRYHERKAWREKYEKTRRPLTAPAPVPELPPAPCAIVISFAWQQECVP